MYAIVHLPTASLIGHQLSAQLMHIKYFDNKEMAEECLRWGVFRVSRGTWEGVFQDYSEAASRTQTVVPKYHLGVIEVQQCMPSST